MICWAKTWKGAGGGATGSTWPSRQSRSRPAARRKPSSDVARNRQLRTAPGRRPVRPSRCRNEVTVAGASSWITRSRSPTSIPSSRVLVATITQSRPRAKVSSARRRSSRPSEPWDTKVRTPACRSAAASASTRARPSQNTRRFSPRWSAATTVAALSPPPTWSRCARRGFRDPAVRRDDASRPRRGGRKPVQQGPRIPYGRGQAQALDLAARQAAHPFENRQQMPAPVVAGERVQLVDDHRFDVPEQDARLRPGRHEHHFEGLRRRQQQVGRFADDGPAGARRPRRRARARPAARRGRNSAAAAIRGR